MVDGVVLLGEDIAELLDAAEPVLRTGVCEDDGDEDGAERGEAGAPHDERDDAQWRLDLNRGGRDGGGERKASKLRAPGGAGVRSLGENRALCKARGSPRRATRVHTSSAVGLMSLKQPRMEIGRLLGQGLGARVNNFGVLWKFRGCSFLPLV